MKGYDDWKTDAPDPDCEECGALDLEECACEERRQEAADHEAELAIEAELERRAGI